LTRSIGCALGFCRSLQEETVLLRDMLRNTWGKTSQ
jgi:hypothetical protein